MTSERTIPWVDPFTNEVLTENDQYLVSKNSRYLIKNGIPNFAEPVSDNEQKQVQESYE